MILAHKQRLQKQTAFLVVDWLVAIMQAPHQPTINLFDEPLSCQSLPVVEQLLDFAKIRVYFRVCGGSNSSDSIILQYKILYVALDLTWNFVSSLHTGISMLRFHQPNPWLVVAGPMCNGAQGGRQLGLSSDTSPHAKRRRSLIGHVRTSDTGDTRRRCRSRRT